MVEQATSLGARLAELAGQHGDAPAVHVEGETLSWRELHTRSNRIAHALIDRGVQQGHLVTRPSQQDGYCSTRDTKTAYPDSQAITHCESRSLSELGFGAFADNKGKRTSWQQEPSPNPCIFLSVWFWAIRPNDEGLL